MAWSTYHHLVVDRPLGDGNHLEHDGSLRSGLLRATRKQLMEQLHPPAGPLLMPLTTSWMTCSGSIPPTEKPFTSTILSPAWSRPRTEDPPGYSSRRRRAGSSWRTGSPLRSARPPWITRAMKISPLTSRLFIVAPWKRRSRSETGGAEAEEGRSGAEAWPQERQEQMVEES